METALVRRQDYVSALVRSRRYSKRFWSHSNAIVPSTKRRSPGAGSAGLLPEVHATSSARRGNRAELGLECCRSDLVRRRIDTRLRYSWVAAILKRWLTWLTSGVEFAIFRCARVFGDMAGAIRPKSRNALGAKGRVRPMYLAAAWSLPSP